MSADSLPISAPRFAAALKDLSLSSLYAKAAELRNSIAHLRRSNGELAEYARAGDAECYEAMTENEEVIRRMEERVGLLQAEVEGRGFKWMEEEVVVNGGKKEGEEEAVDGEGDARMREVVEGAAAVEEEEERRGTAAASAEQRPNGAVANGSDTAEEGVYL